MNEWCFESIFAFFDDKPLFLSILGTFWPILGTFPIRPVSMIPWLLNWIIFWIESADFFWNWIIFWIESWVKQYWIKYWMNHFLAKFKHWIESDWVSDTTTEIAWYNSEALYRLRAYCPRQGLSAYCRIPLSSVSILDLVFRFLYDRDLFSQLRKRQFMA